LWFIWIIPIPVYIYANRFLTKKSAMLQQRSSSIRTRSNEVLYDGCGNVRTVKSFGKELDETKRFVKVWGAFHESEYGETYMWQMKEWILGSFDLIIRVCLIVYCCFKIQQGELTVGETATLLIYQTSIQHPIKELDNVVSETQRMLGRLVPMLKIIKQED